MPRILGVDIPKEKHVDISLTYLYGVGRSNARKILERAGVNPDKRAKDLTEEELSKVTAIIQKEIRVEGELRREISQNIKRLMDIGCWRGLRHRKGLQIGRAHV